MVRLREVIEKITNIFMLPINSILLMILKSNLLLETENTINSLFVL